MLKKYLLIFLILVQSCYALSIELDYTTLGPEQNFLGYIEIEPGTYDPDLEVEVFTEDSSDSIRLKKLVDCDEIDCTGIIDYYTSIDATSLTIEANNTLTGIRIPKGVTSITTPAHFDIACTYPADCPDTPTIDVGDDGSLEWVYPGQATNTFSTPFLGPKRIDNIDIEPIVVTENGNCQRLLLQKSMEYKIQAYMKKEGSSNLDIYIAGVIAKESECGEPTENWNWIECSLKLNKALEKSYYYVCLRSNNGDLLASNSTATNPQGYYNCPTSCQKLDRDFIIQAKGADYVSELTSLETYSISNTRSGEYFYQTLKNYYGDCTFKDNFCTIPIRINSENSKNATLSNLEYKITSDITIIKNRFLSPNAITKVEGEGRIIASDPIIIPLSEFDIETPEDIDEYNLEVEFNNQIKKVTYNVANIPTAKFNSSKQYALVLEKISFDASESISPEDNKLKYKWDFGDNKTGTGVLVDHYYIKQGIYTITLTVIDTVQNISSLPFEKTIEVSSSEVEIKNLVDSTLDKIENAILYMDSTSTDIREVYTDLNLDTKFNQEKSDLMYYKTKISTMEQSQLQKIRDDVNIILSTLPKKISLITKLDIIPYLTYDDIDGIYPSKTNAYKQTLRDLNSRIEKRVEAKLLHITYLSDNREDYILVKKIITPENTLKDISIIEAVPLILADKEDIEFLNIEPQIETAGGYVQAEIYFNKLDSSLPNVILYKISSQNIDLVRDTRTIILPRDFKEKDIPFECGNNVCNPAEDYLSCPEDCTCGNDICDQDETKQTCPRDCRKPAWFLVFLFLLIIVIIGGIIYYAKENPSFARKLKIEKIIDKIKIKNLIRLITRNPFSSESEFKRILNFVKISKQKGYPIAKIRKALQEKGWSQTKINYAIKKAK